VDDPQPAQVAALRNRLESIRHLRFTVVATQPNRDEHFHAAQVTAVAAAAVVLDGDGRVQDVQMHCELHSCRLLVKASAVSIQTDRGFHDLNGFSARVDRW